MKINKILLSLIAGVVGATIMSVSAMATDTETLVIEDDYALKDVEIRAEAGPAIAIAEGADVTLTIVGENYVKGATGYAGIYVPESATLTIVGDGELVAVGGDASEIKDSDYNLYNRWHNYSAGAGIGGNGSYFISDRKTSSKWTEEELEKVYTDISGKQYLAVSNANFGEIIIEMTGSIEATGGKAVTNEGGGAGIGSGGSNPQCYMYFDDDDEKQYYPLEGEIVILSGDVEAIGGSSDNSMSSNSGAGIGAGCSSQAVVDNDINITINGGTIIATGAMDAAAIGGGAHVQGGDITITGGDITAVSGVESTASGNGAGIGAGHMAYTGIIRIEGDAVVSATANGNAAGIGAGADTSINNEDGSSDELHCENVIFGGNAQIEFDGGKTTFFTVEGDDVTFTSDSAVCAIVNDKGVMIGLASSFDEAVSVINEFANVETIRLIKDIEVDKTVVIKDDVTIDGAGYTIKGADVTETETDGKAVTPIAIENAEVTLVNITVKGGNAYNNDPYQPTASHGVGGNAINAKDATVIIDNSTIEGGDAGAVYTKSAGSSINAVNTDIVVTNSTLATGRTMRSGVVGVANIYLDDESTISLTDVVLDTAKSTYANDNVIASIHENGEDSVVYTGDVHLDGVILVNGVRLANVNIVPGENLTLKGNIDASYIADTITVEYVKKDVDDESNDKDEEADLYDIVLVGDAQFINRLTSADLTFKLESETTVKPVYEILPVAPVNVTTDADYENRYMFSFDGVTQPDETAGRIVIAQVKFTGYGAYSFAVDTAFNETNIANATKTNDSVVEHFVPNGDVDAGEGVLDVITNSITAEIVVPTRDLEIVVDFPNEVSKNAAAYQAMTVTVAGGDLDEAIVISLGNEEVETAIATEYEKQEAKFTVDVAADNKYTVNVIDVLTVNTSYNVTVEGAGYRTARYTVTMTEDKTLSFWNNVKDNAINVEEGKDSSAKNVTFLAGDIVKDSVINIYDLSAVVSYFGEVELNVAGTQNDYAKYDLNRDGKIDSKDVAYVLVSWNN